MLKNYQTCSITIAVLLSTLSVGRFPMYNAPMSCSAGISLRGEMVYNTNSNSRNVQWFVDSLPRHVPPPPLTLES
jgi:hypothetical protein